MYALITSRLSYSFPNISKGNRSNGDKWSYAISWQSEDLTGNRRCGIESKWFHEKLKGKCWQKRWQACGGEGGWGTLTAIGSGESFQAVRVGRPNPTLEDLREIRRWEGKRLARWASRERRWKGIEKWRKVKRSEERKSEKNMKGREEGRKKEEAERERERQGKRKRRWKHGSKCSKIRKTDWFSVCAIFLSLVPGRE